MTFKEIIDSLPEEQRTVIQKEIDDRDALVTEKENTITAVTAELEGVKKDLEEAKVVKEKPAEDIIKSADPAIQEAFKKMQEQVEKSAAESAKNAEEVKKMQVAARKVEFVAKAESYKGLPMNPNEFGEVLMRIADAAPEEYAKLEPVLAAADKAIEDSVLFDEIGRTGRASEGSAINKLNQLAQARAEASGGQLTKEQAFVEVAKEHNDLYEQYRKESEV